MYINVTGVLIPLNDGESGETQDCGIIEAALTESRGSYMLDSTKKHSEYLKKRCSYCQRTIAVSPVTKQLVRHKEGEPTFYHNGHQLVRLLNRVWCRASGTKSWSDCG